MSNIAIRVENLSKQYHIGSLNGGRRFDYKSLRDTLADAFTSPFRRARLVLTKEGSLLRGPAYGASEMNETIWALKERGKNKFPILSILEPILEYQKSEVISQVKLYCLLFTIYCLLFTVY